MRVPPAVGFSRFSIGIPQKITAMTTMMISMMMIAVR